jgi:pyrimidine-nucleoside phosphorylase
MLLGAGRADKDSEIDLAVGIKLNKKVGEQIKEGDLLATLYYNDDSDLKEAEEKLAAAYQIGTDKLEERELIYDVIR